MSRATKPLILACSVLMMATFSATLLIGQEPAKKRQTVKKKGAAKVVPVPIPAAEGDAHPVLLAAPGSPEAERLAKFTANVNEGLVKIARFGPDPAEDDSQGFQAPIFSPTEIVAQKEIAADMQAFQAKLSPLFAAHDPIPASRTNHFTWLNSHKNVRIYGWYGTIKAAEVQADSSVIVIIKFAPKTKITGQRAVVLDYVHEKYLIANGELQLIDTDAARTNPAIQVVQGF